MQIFKRIILIIILFLVFISCENYKYTIDENIEAKILGKTNECIGIQYTLGGMTILDDICDLKMSSMVYITTNTIDDKITFRLHVKGTDIEYTSGKTYWTYYLGSEELGKTENKIQMMDLLKLEDKIPSFKWLIIEGVEAEEYYENQKTEPLKKIKEDVIAPVIKNSGGLPSLKVK